MAITVSGVIHGRRIDLDKEASLPDGASVLVRIEPQELSLQERRDLVEATAGAWAGDSSIDVLLDEIEQGRRNNAQRAVIFDDTDGNPPRLGVHLDLPLAACSARKAAMAAWCSGDCRQAIRAGI